MTHSTGRFKVRQVESIRFNKTTGHGDEMETLYVASDKISQECLVGTRKEWEETLEESMYIWFEDDVQRGEVEEGISLEEYINMKLDSELREADEEEVRDFYPIN